MPHIATNLCNDLQASLVSAATSLGARVYRNQVSALTQFPCAVIRRGDLDFLDDQAEDLQSPSYALEILVELSIESAATWEDTLNDLLAEVANEVRSIIATWQSVDFSDLVAEGEPEIVEDAETFHARSVLAVRVVFSEAAYINGVGV